MDKCGNKRNVAFTKKNEVQTKLRVNLFFPRNNLNCVFTN